nr:MAG TPA: hypothetical protein [Caudoviricetes sp.]
MLEQLEMINEAVGKTTLEEVYSMTPREFESVVAGGYKRSYNLLTDMRFALGSSLQPMVMVDPEKYSDDKNQQTLKKRLEVIKSLTDKELQHKLDNQQQQQQRFIDIFMPDKKGGRSS